MGKTGISMEAHLRQLEASGIELGEEGLLLDAICPYQMEYLWAAYTELDSTRGVGFSGPLAISYLELEAWTRVTGVKLSMWEIQTVRQIDRAFLKDFYGRPRRADAAS